MMMMILSVMLLGLLSLLLLLLHVTVCAVTGRKFGIAWRTRWAGQGDQKENSVRSFSCSVIVSPYSQYMYGVDQTLIFWRLIGNIIIYQNCSVLGCVTQCSQSAAHSCEQFLQVQQIRFITLGPLRHA